MSEEYLSAEEIDRRLGLEEPSALKTATVPVVESEGERVRLCEEEMKQLQDGLKSLRDGIEQQLQDGLKFLQDEVEQQLQDRLEAFREGINRIDSRVEKLEDWQFDRSAEEEVSRCPECQKLVGWDALPVEVMERYNFEAKMDKRGAGMSDWMFGSHDEVSYKECPNPNCGYVEVVEEVEEVEEEAA